MPVPVLLGLLITNDYMPVPVLLDFVSPVFWTIDISMVAFFQCGVLPQVWPICRPTHSRQVLNLPLFKAYREQYWTSPPKRTKEGPNFIWNNDMLRRSKKTNRCFPPRRETSVHPPAWTLIGRQALWGAIMSQLLYQKENWLGVLIRVVRGQYWTSPPKRTKEGPNFIWNNEFLRRSKKSNRCLPPRRETSVHPPAWTLIGRQALWGATISQLLYQKENW